MKTTNIVLELEQLGLSEREAKVYLASLQLGPSTAQLMAAKAGITRPTTYLAIEHLVKVGLMTSFQKGKKRYFALEAPGTLKIIVEREEQAIRKRKDNVDHLIKELSALAEKSSLMPIAIAERGDTNSFSDDLGRGDLVAIVSADTSENVSSLLEASLARGSSARVLANAEFKMDTNKAQVRPISLDGKVGAFVASSKAAVVFLANGGPIRILVRDASVVKMLMQMFELCWLANK